MLKFSVAARDGRARAGLVQTDHGEVETPVFMPVGTQGSVKAIEQRELEQLGSRIILGNTYHLYLRPGEEVLRNSGGLHSFMSWQRSILTDSGGYQVFSLGDLRTIDRDGVTFRSHLDGSTHRFSPESVMAMQRVLGSDIMMVLDECTPFPCEPEYARSSNELTLQWAQRCREDVDQHGPLYGHSQSVFGIVQGSVYPDIREQSVRGLVKLDFDGYAIGGLAVGEPPEVLYTMVDVCEPMLPPEKPRYLMGVGTPENLLEAIERGIDMFDCVLPTRNGRNAMIFTRNGPLSIKNAGFKNDQSPVDSECSCYTCRTFSRAYIRHLFQVGEILAMQLATIHNLSFYLWLMGEARTAILHGRFAGWKCKTLALLREPAVSLSH